MGHIDHGKIRVEMAVVSPLIRSIITNSDELSMESGLEKSKVQENLKHFGKIGKVRRLESGSSTLTVKFEELKRRIMDFFNTSKNRALAQSCLTREEIYSKIKPPFFAGNLSIITTKLNEEVCLNESHMRLYSATISLNPHRKGSYEQDT